MHSKWVAKCMFSRVDGVASWCNDMNYDVHALMMQRAIQLELQRRGEKSTRTLLIAEWLASLCAKLAQTSQINRRHILLGKLSPRGDGIDDGPLVIWMPGNGAPFRFNSRANYSLETIIKCENIIVSAMWVLHVIHSIVISKRSELAIPNAVSFSVRSDLLFTVATRNDFHIEFGASNYAFEFRVVDLYAFLRSFLPA